MSFQNRDGKIAFGVVTSLLMAGLVSAAGAQAPGPVSTGGNTYKVNADVDTYFVDFGGTTYTGLVEPATAEPGVAANSINDEDYVTMLLPNLNGGSFLNSDFNISVASGSGIFAQPDFNGNLYVATGASVDQGGEADDGESYGIGEPDQTNNYTNSTANSAAFTADATKIAENYILPTGNGSNNYGDVGTYISIGSSGQANKGTDASSLDAYLNNLEKSYTSAPSTPVYVTFTFESDNPTDTANAPNGKLSGYLFNGLFDQTPEYLSYTDVPASAPSPTPEPAAWTTLGLGFAAVAGRMLVRKRSTHQN